MLLHELLHTLEVSRSKCSLVNPSVKLPQHHQLYNLLLYYYIVLYRIL